MSRTDASDPAGRDDARHEHDVEGLEELPPEERDDVIEAARDNPDPITRRESLEQELMELGASDAGETIADSGAVAEEPETTRRGDDG